MSNYSVTNADMSRESREELYDGTALITRVTAEGVETTELVPSDEQAPVPEPEPIDPVVVEVVVEDFAVAIVGAENMQAMKDAAQALLDALGGA